MAKESNFSLAVSVLLRFGGKRSGGAEQRNGGTEERSRGAERRIRSDDFHLFSDSE